VTKRFRCRNNDTDIGKNIETSYITRTKVTLLCGHDSLSSIEFIYLVGQTKIQKQKTQIIRLQTKLQHTKIANRWTLQCHCCGEGISVDSATWCQL